MTNDETPAGPPSEVVAARIKRLRKENGLTVQELAKQCAQAGSPELTATMIYNIESGRPDKDGNRRRHVTVDEVMTFAVAMDVSPFDLLFPKDDDAPYQPTPTEQVTAHQARAWARGVDALDPSRRDIRHHYAAMAEVIPEDQRNEIVTRVVGRRQDGRGDDDGTR